MGLAPYRPLELMRNKAATRSDFQDFIGVWEGFVPKPFCEELIKYGDDVLNENTAALAVGNPQSLYGVPMEDRNTKVKEIDMMHHLW